jgi:hypothetical protein
VKLSRIRNTRGAYFPSYGEDRSKDKHIYKNKLSYINSNRNMFVTAYLLYGTWGKRERKRE